MIIRDYHGTQLELYIEVLCEEVVYMITDIYKDGAGGHILILETDDYTTEVAPDEVEVYID